MKFVNLINEWDLVMNVFLKKCMLFYCDKHSIPKPVSEGDKRKKCLPPMTDMAY